MYVHIYLDLFYDGPFECISLYLFHRNVTHKGINHLALQLLGSYTVKYILVGQILLTGGEKLYQVNLAICQQ